MSLLKIVHSVEEHRKTLNNVRKRQAVHGYRFDHNVEEFGEDVGILR